MKFFVIDVESIGLHGEGFAVGGVLCTKTGYVWERDWEFRLACPPHAARGIDGSYNHSEDRLWVAENIPAVPYTHFTPEAVRSEFWSLWLKAKAEGAIMVADCGWPVEAGFLAQCIKDAPSRALEGPYPLHELASYLAAAGFDPLKTYDRLDDELPKHDPLCDARQSERLLAIAFS